MQTIHHSHRLALELTPANPENLTIDINNSLIKSAHRSSSNSYNIQYIQENDDDISSSINIASREIGRNSNDLDDDDDSSSVNIFSEWPNATNEFSDSLSVFK
ncbi:unnamed protein product [Rhizophagus irregularis]|nr:unnamed protein product [Rhizophagus irregularis]CAB5375848.1 unnamed protein product [Rhizophagus irregularis]